MVRDNLLGIKTEIQNTKEIQRNRRADDSETQSEPGAKYQEETQKNKVSVDRDPQGPRAHCHEPGGEASGCDPDAVDSTCPSKRTGGDSGGFFISSVPLPCTEYAHQHRKRRHR